MLLFGTSTTEQKPKLRRVHAKQCRCCGAAFSTVFKRRIYCSTRCKVRFRCDKMKAKRHARGMKTCASPACNARFFRRNKRHLYCCRRCLQHVARVPYERKYSVVGEQRKCGGCSRHFVITDPRQALKLYCAPKCQQRAWARARNQQRALARQRPQEAAAE